MTYCVGIIPTNVGIIPTFVRTIPTLVGIIPTPQEDVLHFVPCVGIFLTKIQQSGNISYKILQKFSIQLYTCRNQVSYTSAKFLPALYPKIMISSLIWNMLKSNIT